MVYAESEKLTERKKGKELGSCFGRAVVLAEQLFWQSSFFGRAVLLAEQLLPTTEVCSSNLVIGKIYIEHLFTENWIIKTKITEKRQEMAHF